MSNRMFRQRRDFLCAVGVAGMATLLPRLSLGYVETDSRLVFVMLRGALDGLAAVAPYGDGNYQRLRGALALSEPGADKGALKLDGLFALHPSLRNMHARYQSGELLPIHAVASPYRERSHFDGQDLLENGTITPHGALDGWLNRALSGVDNKARSAELAIAFAQNVPLVLRGANRVASWAPSRLPETDSETLQRLASLYANDSYFLSRLQTAIATDAIADAGDMANPMQAVGQTGIPRNDSLAQVAAAAGKMLRQKDGPRVAVMEATGWDTHANQGAEQGVLALRLAALDRALEQLRIELGDAWRQTVMMIATEFGRTAAINGTRGTDHGTGTAAFLVGGAVNGGKVLCDWPGLGANDLYEGRDLRPTTDIRSVFKGVLGAHMGVSESLLESKVFAGSSGARPLSNLVRGA